MISRRNTYLVPALIPAIILFALSSREYTGAGLAGALLIAGLFTPRVKADTAGQIILALFCAVAAYIIVMVFGVGALKIPPGDLGAIETTTALWLIFAAVTRPFIACPRGGIAVDAGIVFSAVLSMGNVRHGWRYPVMALAVVVLLLLAMRRADGGRTPWPVLLRHRRRPIILILAGALTISGSLIAGLPVIYHWGYHRMMRHAYKSTVGFGQSLRLGSLRGVLQSTAIVMRVYGPGTDYLRGYVYYRYLGGNWFGDRRSGLAHQTADAAAGDPSTTTTIRMIGGDRDRFFLPLKAAKIGIPGGSARIDGSGILLPPGDEAAESVHFHPSLYQGSAQALAPPTEMALSLPDNIAPFLKETAIRWTRGITGQRARLSAIETRLHRDYRYSLEFERPAGVDPLVAFLTTQRKGHCEYFASAMALLARSIGIPTRVVAGYRVFEYNPLGGYAVVRQRNAHTWVEAWTPDDGWLTYEPTPATGFFEEMPTRTPLFSAALDMAAVMLRYLGRRAAALTLGQIALGAGVLLAAWTAMVLLRRLRRRDKKAIPDFRSYAAPPESIVRLMTALAAAGHCRHDSEPIDRYTTRVAATMLSRDSGGVLVRLIDDYNQWRFAGRGDVRALAARIDAWIDTMPSRGSGAG